MNSKKVIRLSESDLENIIQQVLKEQSFAMGSNPLCPVQCGDKVLGKGNSGEDVKLIQNALSKCGFGKTNEGGGMTPGCGRDYKTCDGIFDDKTKKAVREFQKARGLSVDGVVGPNTLKELTKSTSSKDACLEAFECGCNKKPSTPPKSDKPNSHMDVKVSCEKSKDCFQKFDDGDGTKCGLYKCLGICIPDGRCTTNKDCGKCPKWVNGMPGIGTKKSRTDFVKDCIERGCTTVAH